MQGRKESGIAATLGAEENAPREQTSKMGPDRAHVSPYGETSGMAVHLGLSEIVSRDHFAVLLR